MFYNQVTTSKFSSFFELLCPINILILNAIKEVFYYRVLTRIYKSGMTHLSKNLEFYQEEHSLHARLESILLCTILVKTSGLFQIFQLRKLLNTSDLISHIKCHHVISLQTYKDTWKYHLSNIYQPSETVHINL